ncbi:MAG: hypothetical protein ACFFCW_01875 [Candidatus Hodarchaeota archaeon]
MMANCNTCWWPTTLDDETICEYYRKYLHKKKEIRCGGHSCSYYWIIGKARLETFPSVRYSPPTGKIRRIDHNYRPFGGTP